MRGIDRFSICFVAFVLTAGLALGGCGAQKPATKNGSGKESASDSSVSQQSGKEEDITYIARNEKYGLQLPDGDAFGEIFKDFIYWDYATQIEKHEDKLENEGNILGRLQAMKLLDRDVKIRLYYRECDKEEMDYRESNFYHVIVGFPESEDTGNSWLSMEYSSRGLSSEYDWGCFRWMDCIKQISFEELEQSKEIIKQYTSMGETSIAVSEAEAKAYQPENRFPEGEKEQILKDIENAVKHEYKEARDTMLFIHDFLPGDFSLSGKEVDFNMTDKYDVPVCWIQSAINYSGDKLEQLDGIYWTAYYSTAYSGAGQPDYNSTLEFLKQSAKSEAEEMDADKCILAFHIKDGKVIGINDHSPSLTEKEEVLGSNDYSSVLTEKKVREELGIPDEAHIAIKYGKETYYKKGFGNRIVSVVVYEDGNRVAGGYFCIQNGSAGCNLTGYEAPEKE